MPQIKVLIVDDSVFYRGVIADLLSAGSGIKVIGTAQNGQEALEKVLSLKPDLVTMGVFMPKMDGLEAIERIMAQSPTPILVITSSQETTILYSAITRGALEVIPKSALASKNADRIIQQVKLLAKVKTISHIRGNKASMTTPLPPRPGREKKVIAIAASTGGPQALSNILSGLPENYPIPIMVAQHIDPNFISRMIDWLNSIVKIRVKEAEQGEQILGGTVYFASATKHLTISDFNKIKLVDKRLGDIFTPSCNMLIESVAKNFGPSSIGIILSGMSNDGVAGMEKLKCCGGITIAQDESSSVVFGMPKLAIESGCIDIILPLDRVSQWLINFTKNNY